MSPQINGEEGLRVAGRGVTQPLSADEEPPALPPPLQSSRVVKTVRQAPDPAPLFSHKAVNDFHSRWDLIQKGFVDDPKDSVHSADEMIREVAQSLAARFAEQRAALEGRFEPMEEPTTESLRLTLRQYRAFLDRLLSL